MNHDYTERFIGDIKTPVKYANKELRAMLSTVEEKMTDAFIEEEIPGSFQATYRRRLADGKDNSLEGQLLAIADKIDLLYESFEEISKSNPDKVYKEMFREAVLTVKEFQHRPCVTYFFEAIFPELLNADFYGKTAFLEEKTKNQEMIHLKGFNETSEGIRFDFSFFCWIKVKIPLHQYRLPFQKYCRQRLKIEKVQGWRLVLARLFLALMVENVLDI